MTTYNVMTATDTSSADDGTLEYALANAKGDDTIQFAQGVSGDTFALPKDFALPNGTLTLDIGNVFEVTIGGGALTDLPGGRASLVVACDSGGAEDFPSTLILTHTNTYTGSTTVGGGARGATLQGGALDAFGSDSAVSLLGQQGFYGLAVLDLGGYAQVIGSLADALNSSVSSEIVTNSGNAAALTLGGDNTSTVFSGAIQNGNGQNSSVALDKTGTGTFTLRGANNTYTGGTTLDGGTLELGAQGAAGATATNSQTAGGVAFRARGTTLQIDSAALTTPASTTTQSNYAAPVTGFASGETLDLSGLAYVAGSTTASLSGNTLTVTNGTSTDTLTDFALGAGLAAGYYTFATAQDANTTKGTDVTLSLNAPSAPALAAGQDTGASSTDGLTDIRAPRFTGTGAAPNATITLYDGAGTTAIGTGTSDANGNYTATVTTPLADGPHSITATVTDAGGDVSARSGAAAITVDATPPTASSVVDTVAQGSGPAPIGLAAPTDNQTPAGSLAIAAGALPTDGRVTLANGTPVVSGQTLTATQLTSLLFTPTGAAGQSSAFVYTVTDGAGNAAQGTATLNVGAPPSPAPNPSPAPSPAPSPSPAPGPSPAPDVVSIAQQVSYNGSAFAISGTVSAATGVRSVEISAVVDGVATDLGAATVDANGAFVFSDLIGASTQSFITATEIDGAGRTASGQADYSLRGGLDQPSAGRAPFVAEQDVYNADGSATTSVALFRGDGSPSNDASRRTTIMASGQTFTADQFDDYESGGKPSTTFVFGQNHGLDTIDGFRLTGADHDTLSFTGADFGNSIATLLQYTYQIDSSGNAIRKTDPIGQSISGISAGSGVIIYDPVTKDTVKLNQIPKFGTGTSDGFAAYAQQDVTFHA